MKINLKKIHLNFLNSSNANQHTEKPSQTFSISNTKRTIIQVKNYSFSFFANPIKWPNLSKISILRKMLKSKLAIGIKLLSNLRKSWHRFRIKRELISLMLYWTMFTIGNFFHSNTLWSKNIVQTKKELLSKLSFRTKYSTSKSKKSNSYHFQPKIKTWTISRSKKFT